jgi:lipopolysaccharide assembly protein A
MTSPDDARAQAGQGNSGQPLDPQAAANPQAVQSAQPGQAGQPVAGQQAAPGLPQKPHKVRRTRMSSAWVSIVLFAIVLVLLLVFILENSQKVNISFFGVHGHLPLGVAMLFAAVLGVLLIVIPGVGRIIQLRRTARRHRKQDVKAAAAAPPASR